MENNPHVWNHQAVGMFGNWPEVATLLQPVTVLSEALEQLGNQGGAPFFIKLDDVARFLIFVIYIYNHMVITIHYQLYPTQPCYKSTSPSRVAPKKCWTKQMYKQ